MKTEDLVSSLKQGFAGDVIYEKGSTFGPRIQRNLQIVLIISGSVDITVNDTDKYHVKEGFAILLLPFQKEYFKFNSTACTYHKWIELEAAEALDYSALPAYIPHIITKDFNELCNMAINEKLQPSRSGAIETLLAQTAIIKFCQEITAELNINQNEQLSNQIYIYLKKNYNQDLDLNDLSKVFGYSKEHIIRVFKTITGKTPINTLWDIRLERALELITNTGLQFNDIAQTCGFKSYYHFAKFIKQRIGKTPSEIRIKNLFYCR